MQRPLVRRAVASDAAPSLRLRRDQPRSLEKITTHFVPKWVKRRQRTSDNARCRSYRTSIVETRGLPRQPALDGLRAVAVGLVLVFHLGTSWLPGGYLGVSVFFTLSGYLITSLLLHERATTGGIRLLAFYGRRVRRLLPASVLTLCGVAVLAHLGAFPVRERLAGEMHAALLNVANWDALLSGRSYSDLFRAASPVAHFWSLAVEEQFYAVWPVVILALTWWAGRSSGSRRLGWSLSALFVALSASAVVTARWSGPDAVYLASWTRFAEIVAGAALAALLAGRQVPRRAGRLTLPCLVAIVALAAVTPAGRGWAYAGGLPLFAILTAVLLWSLQTDSAVRRVLCASPLVWIGSISYGLYLYHWPVFSVLDPARTGLDGLPLATVRIAVSLALAAASYRLVEAPIRDGSWRVPVPARLTVGATVVAGVVLLATSVPMLERAPATSEPVVLGAVASAAATAAPTPVVDSPEAIAAPTPVVDSPEAPAPSSAAPSSAARRPAVPSPPPVVAIFGDSVADWLLRDASSTFDRSDLVVIDAAAEACDGAVEPPRLRDRHGSELFPPADCRPWTEAYPEVVERQPVDVAVLVLGQAPLVDRLVDGAWIGPCTDMRWYLRDVEKRMAYMQRHVPNVVLALPAWGGPGATWSLPDDHQLRTACVRDQLSALAGRAGVRTIDLADELCPEGPTSRCNDLRSLDGTHVDPEDAPAVLDWLLARSISPHV